MKLIGSALSPFVRYTRAVLAELGIEYDYHEVSSMADPTPEDLAYVTKNNPAMKIPILEDGGKTVIDSRIIANYLLRKSDKTIAEGFDAAMNDEKEHHLTILYAVADAALMRFIIPKTHPEIDLKTGYMARSLDRIKSGLTYLEGDDTFGKTFGLPELLSIFLLEWFAARSVYDWSGHEKLRALYNEHKDRHSITYTRPTG